MDIVLRVRAGCVMHLRREAGVGRWY